MPTLSELPHSFVVVLAVSLGMVLASFGNVVIYRLPRGMNLSHPGSTCPKCGTKIRPYDNIPVLSWVFLRGKARCCGTKISPRYVLLEGMGGLLGFALCETTLTRLAPDLPFWQVLTLIFLYLILTLGLICAAFIDLEHMILPDEITLGGAALGLATVSLRPEVTFWESLLGAAVGFLVIWLPFDVLYRAFRGHAGMGMGDAKLLLLAGAWFGWPAAIFALLVGAVQGTCVAVAVYAATGKLEEPAAVTAEREEMLKLIEAAAPEAQAALREEFSKDLVLQEQATGLAKSRFAFGPFLVLGILEYTLFGPEFTQLYLSLAGFE